MAPVDLPYLNIYRSRGRMFGYYRRQGQRIRIRGEVGSADFLANYQRVDVEFEARAPARRSPEASAIPGSFRALVETYRASPEFRQLAASSRRDYGRAIDGLIPKYGDLPVALMPRAWIIARRNELQDKPRSANFLVAVIRRLLSYAVDLEWRPDNPALRIGSLRTGPGYRAWTDAEVMAMTGPGAPAWLRLPVLIGLYTGQREGDILRLPWSSYDGLVIRVRPSKARRQKSSLELTIPVHPALRTELGGATRLALVICTTETGRPWTTHHFVHRFAEARTKLGLPDDLTFHGLRYSAASRLAEAGASDAEIQAITGHATRAMVGKYSAGARQRVMAEGAIARLPGARKKNGE